MKTKIEIDGAKFLINGVPTYQGREYNGRSIEGLLFNSRMIQAIFDDENEATRINWLYPDSGKWDADRNTDEFCNKIPVYRSHGLLAFTVGLQGGGSIYSPNIYDNYLNSAISPDGSLKPAYFERLDRVLRAADDAGIVVIVNYFYWKQIEHMPNEQIIKEATARISEWLLSSGFENILVDVANEANSDIWTHPLFYPDRVHELLDIVQNTVISGRRLLAGISTAGGDQLPEGKWREMEDLHLPHGNGCTPEQLKNKLIELKTGAGYEKSPRPVIVNEDSPSLDNLIAALEAGCSWGYFEQGNGSGDKMYGTDPREKSCSLLSGYQTMPTNWGINTPQKKAFFDKLKEITGGG